jgi:hypothetical protein
MVMDSRVAVWLHRIRYNTLLEPDHAANAFALLGHAAWDAHHYLRDRVVARSYAEFCGVLDLLVGAAILVMA